MYHAKRLTDTIFWTGINDHETMLFEELWPMPQGITYNSYFIQDKRSALIDAARKSHISDLLESVREALGNKEEPDYLIINHIEPDHSGGIALLRNIFPGLKIVGNAKTMELLLRFHGISDNLETVGDGDTLDLGSRRISFHITPMVHWPETMMSFDEGDRVLFSGDMFGGYGALDDGITDADIVNRQTYEDEMLRYFTNVIGKYSSMAVKAIEKISSLDTRIVAPSHGIIWKDEPERPVSLYERWSRQETIKGAVIVYASMYGSTENMMEAVARGIAGEGLDVRIHNVSRSHPSYILRDVWQYERLVLGGPTYNMHIFPLMDHFVRILENKSIKHRRVGLFGSHGWVGGATDELKKFVEKMSWELVEPVIDIKGAPTRKDLEECERLGREIAAQ